MEFCIPRVKFDMVPCQIWLIFFDHDFRIAPYLIRPVDQFILYIEKNFSRFSKKSQEGKLSDVT